MANNNEELREEIKGIALQIGRIVSHIESESGNRERTQRALDKLNECLFGDGTKNGLIAKVNQLLATDKDRKKLQTSIFIVVIGLVVTKFWELLKH